MNSKERDSILNIVTEGDEWVRNIGLITDSHKNIIVHFMEALPRVEDYDIYIDPDAQRMDIVLHIRARFLDLFTKKEPKAIQLTYEFLTNYLPSYEINVRSIRLKSEGKNETK